MNLKLKAKVLYEKFVAAQPKPYTYRRWHRLPKDTQAFWFGKVMPAKTETKAEPKKSAPKKQAAKKTAVKKKAAAKK